MTPARIISKLHDEEEYIVDSGDGRYGFVADLGNGVRYQQLPIDSIAKEGDWRRVEHDPKLLERILLLPLHADPRHRVRKDRRP